MSDHQPLFPGPARPPGTVPPVPKPPVPKEVTIAFVIWVLTAVVGAVVQLVNLDPLVKSYQRQLGNSGQSDVLSYGELRTAAFAGVIVAALLWLFFAWKMRSGKNWARVVLSLLAVVGLMAQAVAVGFSDVLAIVEVLVTATGLVFMFMPPANAYFGQFRRQPFLRP
ncbi:hypothetical protein [Actinocrispum wychmicini]|uniref:Uncharacterized protein n=1 Tax=Actinocrispum wychmicini TaxID=1213861 RepID=A0A4R2JXH5_9PSEU|nr:hypothetical protein [Actinocrispum wychmicini]TCO65233.1 hypothetical protein EV192_1011021 [Actinocrispum wychmicini]